jgi:hypothetical protein
VALGLLRLCEYTPATLVHEEDRAA